MVTILTSTCRLFSMIQHLPREHCHMIATLSRVQAVFGSGFEHLILLTLLLALALHGLGADLLVILLEGGKILTTLGELTLLHTLTDIPVDEGTLGVHKIELVVHAGE